MTPFPPFFAGRCGQRGVSLVAAIFLLVLMAGLAAFMASILTATHVNLAADIGGSRAYQAARAGVEWGMFQLDPNAQTAALPNCFASTTLNSLPGHAVTVDCEVFPSSSTFYQEGGRQIRMFRITSTASAVGVKEPGIERRIVATLEKCRDAALAPGAPYGC